MPKFVSRNWDELYFFSPQVIISLVVPPLIFWTVAYAIGFWVRRDYPRLLSVIIGLWSLVPIVFFLIYLRRTAANKKTRWYVWIAVGSAIALLGGCLLGDMLWWQNSFSYYRFHDLATYVNIDPESDRGQTFMDAGEVYFASGTRVDVHRAVAFKQRDVYCAAPICSEELSSPPPGEDPQPPAAGTQDWWAVGVNCCEPTGLGFQCEAAGNRLARSGLRLLRDDLRPMFKMAVDQWQSKNGIPVKHPLFFYWVQDPKMQINSFMNGGNIFFRSTFIAFTFVNTVLVLLFKGVVVKHYLA
mmetsp:Transcript_20198/g.44795  ORF Transcript_20198/g.44795 Transcript_20198/m.44795 type:complete len:299 (-) Transcript_20198:91-987(-)|eukprot:CAMPEP_0204273788 /NCGR_PEP_ID=MMETSP0468-20130131/24329_1 /ASSEMBLY_ACC=CAM_ASM_000383 /TAXON_ID=2969 /ORGANISM="Oxyrrhis marina" /LENGTH=298 /DNA_ID=CAMNT_0051249895 /DNA_START=62 /DNA_END=958 /DNA_ORIENTATION=+